MLINIFIGTENVALSHGRHIFVLSGASWLWCGIEVEKPTKIVSPVTSSVSEWPVGRLTPLFFTYLRRVTC